VALAVFAIVWLERHRFLPGDDRRRPSFP
jgi:hypothetical protein